jgi:hypothetical protein
MKVEKLRTAPHWRKSQMVSENSANVSDQEKGAVSESL